MEVCEHSSVNEGQQIAMKTGSLSLGFQVSYVSEEMILTPLNPRVNDL